MMIFRWRRTLLFLADAGLFYLALALALMARRMGPVPLDFFTEHAQVFSVFIPVWLGLFFVVGLYDLRRINKLVNLVNSSLMAFAANLAITVGMFYVFPTQMRITPKINLFLIVILFHIATMLLRRFWTRYLLAKVLIQRVAFLGTNRLVEEIKKDLKKNPHIGFVTVELPELSGEAEKTVEYWAPRWHGEKELSSKVDLLVVDAEDAEKNPVHESRMLSTAVMEEVPIVTHLDFYEDIYAKIPPEHAAKPSWLLSNVLGKGHGFYALVKRGMDVAAAVFGLLCALPVYAGVAVFVKVLESPASPVFYVQKRIGHLGRRFIIWKFRTMVSGADKAGPLYSSASGDSRITAVGRFLRSTRLDELPQLWNVLKGDMSLVGPRPEWIREVRILERAIPHYHLRHLVKPGLTGWAQVNYRATASASDSIEKLHYDLYYVKNMSFALDAGIILRTFRRVFQKDASFDREKIINAN